MNVAVHPLPATLDRLTLRERAWLEGRRCPAHDCDLKFNSTRDLVCCVSPEGQCSTGTLKGWAIRSLSRTSNEGEKEEPVVESAVNYSSNYCNGHEPTHDVDSWKLVLHDGFKRTYHEMQKKDLGRAVWQDATLELVVGQLRTYVNKPNDPLSRPPAGLTPIEIEEELESMARAEMAAFHIGEDVDRLPAERDDDVYPPIEDEYVDRHAVDAYDVYQQLLAEKKTYSWAGLCRDGGSVLVSAVIGAGKTTLALNVARGWANGEVVLGRQCRQSRVLVVVSPKEYDNWAETIGLWGLPGAIWIIESPKAHFGNPMKAADWFEAEMRRLEARCFVLDTLFDFYGHSASGNASNEVNREVMNEQSPLLMKVRENNWSGIVTGHSPKSEAQAINPRDPEEAFSGANAWAAQHRMRIRLRRAGEITGIMSGRGGYGDEGILEEQLLQYEAENRLVSLGGLWTQKEGVGAWPVVKRAMEALDGGASMSKLVETTGKSETFLRAGLRFGKGEREVKKVGSGRSTRYILKSAFDSLDTLFHKDGDGPE